MEDNRVVCQTDLFWKITLLVVFFPFSSISQGLLFNDHQYDSLSRFPEISDGSKAELESLKNIRKVDLRPFCPTPQDQGLIASCTGWAAGYGALTILKAIENGWEGKQDFITQNAFSALFIYNQIKQGSCEFGAYLSDAALLLRDKGDVFSRDFDRLKNQCDKQPTQQEINDALTFRIKDCLALFGTGDAPNIKIMRTKLALAQKKPVAIGISLLKNFELVGGGIHYWFSEIGDTTSLGGHSMVVVGFDDGLEAFEVMNSWGPSWGNSGFVWIKYKDFVRYVHYGYIFIPEHEQTGFYDFIGSMMLQQPVYLDNVTLSFNELQVDLIKNVYVVGGTAKPGTLIQPVLKEVKRNSYFYAFSFDARKTVKVHWPRDAKLDDHFTGNNESAILPFPEINLAIPGEYSALQLNYPGVEYLCFLIAERPIENLNTYLTLLKSSPISDFPTRFNKVFKNLLVSPGEIRYSKEQIQVEGVMKIKQAIPILVKIVVSS